MKADLARAIPARRLGLGLAVAGALLASGCAAGQVAQTADQNPSQQGVDTTLGNLNLNGILVSAPSGVAYQPGDSAGVRLVISNSGRTRDTLTSITSPSFTGWAAYRTTADATAALEAASATPSSQLTGSSSAAVSTPAGSSSATGSSGSSASTSASGSSGSTSASGSTATAGPPTTATSSASATPVPRPQRTITIPAGNRVSWGVPEAKGALLLTRATTRIAPGSVIVLTFTFRSAGRISVRVPVEQSSAAYNSVIPGPSATGEAG